MNKSDEISTRTTVSPEFEVQLHDDFVRARNRRYQSERRQRVRENGTRVAGDVPGSIKDLLIDAGFLGEHERNDKGRVWDAFFTVGELALEGRLQLDKFPSKSGRQTLTPSSRSDAEMTRASVKSPKQVTRLERTRHANENGQ